jgi:hypothetical protein
MCCQEAAALQAALEAFAPGRFHVQGGSAAAPGEPKEHEIVDRTMATSGRRGSYGELLVWLGRVIMGVAQGDAKGLCVGDDFVQHLFGPVRMNHPFGEVVVPLHETGDDATSPVVPPPAHRGVELGDETFDTFGQFTGVVIVNP